MVRKIGRDTFMTVRFEPNCHALHPRVTLCPVHQRLPTKSCQLHLSPNQALLRKFHHHSWLTWRRAILWRLWVRKTWKMATVKDLESLWNMKKMDFGRWSCSAARVAPWQKAICDVLVQTPLGWMSWLSMLMRQPRTWKRCIGPFWSCWSCHWWLRLMRDVEQSWMRWNVTTRRSTSGWKTTRTCTLYSQAWFLLARQLWWTVSLLIPSKESGLEKCFHLRHLKTLPLWQCSFAQRARIKYVQDQRLFAGPHLAMEMLPDTKVVLIQRGRDSSPWENFRKRFLWCWRNWLAQLMASRGSLWTSRTHLISSQIYTGKLPASLHLRCLWIHPDWIRLAWKNIWSPSLPRSTMCAALLWMCIPPRPLAKMDSKCYSPWNRNRRWCFPLWSFSPKWERWKNRPKLKLGKGKIPTV